MTTRQFNESVNADIQRMTNKAKPYSVQVCNGGDWPEHLPQDFESWLKSNNDAIDIGGNWTPDRVLSNHEQYDARPFDGKDAEEWMRRSDIDQQGENL